MENKGNERKLVDDLKGSEFITSDQDRLVPPEESSALYERAGEPKKLMTLKGYGHYEVYREPAFSEVMRETIAWYQRYVPAR